MLQLWIPASTVILEWWLRMLWVIVTVISGNHRIQKNKRFFFIFKLIKMLVLRCFVTLRTVGWGQCFIVHVYVLFWKESFLFLAIQSGKRNGEGHLPVSCLHCTGRPSSSNDLRKHKNASCQAYLVFCQCPLNWTVPFWFFVWIVFPLSFNQDLMPWGG